MEEQQVLLDDDLEDIEVRPFYIFNSFCNTNESQTQDMLEVENLYNIG